MFSEYKSLYIEKGQPIIFFYLKKQDLRLEVLTKVLIIAGDEWMLSFLKE